ncbi:glycoside hydrolase family 97 protein [Neorhodopirellula lusitana]|uniref:glycoside hydrolase family 97 protein n=1 Tax=Neorhodopirellula lusitana TaxID=445327 RepID=UPI00384DFAAB
MNRNPFLALCSSVSMTLQCVAVAGIVLASLNPAQAVELSSPDQKLVVDININEQGDLTNLLNYSIKWQGRSVLTPSSLGLDTGSPSAVKGVQIHDVQTCSNDQTWTPVCGERNAIRDHYNETTLVLQTMGKRPTTIEVTFRAFNEGLAFRYTVPKQAGLDQISIQRELSEFQFPADHKTWVAYQAQADYEQAKLSEVRNGCERPLTIQASEDLYIAIGEAGLVDYARMRLGPAKAAAAGKASSPAMNSNQPSNGPTALVSQLTGKVQTSLPCKTPWRFVMVANRPGELIENNHLVLNLNEPCAIQDTSWIRPGKVLREVTLTTVGGKAAVDFAVEHQMEFIHFDAGWYGNEYDDASDATTVTVDPNRSRGPLDLQDVIAYAKERGVGVLVYVNRRALETQLDEILPLYQSWGIAGVKYGFVNVGSQKWTTWLHEAIRKAAAHHLMVDVHDEYRPTGYERTYPNLMTAEGIGGDETSPTNKDTMKLLFSRTLCGPSDHTVCYYSQRVDENATHAYQLAKAVCFYSPWQFLYWYDRPAKAGLAGGAGGGAQIIGDEPELEFFDTLPTTWDETRVLEGEIGKYAVIARRSGKQWFIGVMNSGTDRTFKLPLDFLASNEPYTAHRYLDDPAANTRTHVSITRTPVNQSSVLEMSVSAQGGQAIRIAPNP